MLGEDSAATDADAISLDGLVITDTTAEEEGGDAKCGNIPVPSNSPDLVDQEFYDDDNVFPAPAQRRNASYDVFQLNNVIYGPHEEHCSTFEDKLPSVPATDSGISVTSGVSDDFPYADLATIDRMLNSVNWKVPVEPGKELEGLLKASLELAQTELDDENEGCQKFYQDTLTTSFHKIMTDKAVNSWTPEIQGYIFDNSTLLVKLMAMKMKSENSALISLMSTVFNPTSKFHHYNASQPSKTVPPSSQIPGADIFARPTDLRVPKGWLIDLINHFGSEGGFLGLLEKFNSFSSPSLEVIEMYLKPFGLCIDLLTSSCIQTYLIPCTKKVTEYVRNLPEEQLKKETKVETRNDTLSALIQSLKMILQRAPQDKKALLQGAEILHLDILLKLVKTSSFNGKMNALNEINRIITPFLFNRRQNQDSDSMTSEDLACWLIDQKILNTLLTDYLHLPQYVEKLDKILKFLIHEDKLSTRDIDLIWDAQIDKHEAIVKNIHDLLAKLAWVLNPDSLDAIFVRFQRSWETASHKDKEKLLELMGRLAEDDKEGVISDKVLQVLWLLITARDTSTDIIDLALSTHIKILNYVYSHADKDKLRLYWIEKCIQNIRHHHCVVASLKHLREMCKLYSESHHGFGYVHKMKQLERDNTLIQLVINDIEFYLDQTKKVPDIQETSPTDILPSRSYSHNNELNERLEFIRFTLKLANCYLSLTHAVQLWKHLTQQKIYESDMDTVFTWFGELVGEDSDIESSVSKHLFVDKMLALEPTAYTAPGLRCFEKYFKEVNESEKREAKSEKLTEDDSQSLIGTDYIWRLVIEGREELAKHAIALLKDVYSSATVSHQFIRHNEFVKTCFTKARQCFYQYEVQNYPAILAKQAIRILHVLREYIVENTNKEGGCYEGTNTPSHERSWQGIPLLLIAQVLGPHDKVVENAEFLTHTNELLGTIRRNLTSHIHKNDTATNPPQLQLKVNNEELPPSLDRKALVQLDIKDRQVITVRVLNNHLLTSPGSADSGDLFNSPCSPIKQTKYLPWLLHVSAVALNHDQVDLCDAVTAILNIFPTDVEIEQDIIEMTAVQAQEYIQIYNDTNKRIETNIPPAIDTILSTALFLDTNCGGVRYKLEIVYALLMPASPSERSAKFRSDFILAGGIEIVISLLQSDRFLAGSDKKTRQSCLYIFAKITKFVLTTLCYGTLALLKKLGGAGSRTANNLQNALTSIPNPSIERVLRSAAHHTIACEDVLHCIRSKVQSVPNLIYIQAIFRLTWRCGFGYPLTPHPVDKETCHAPDASIFLFEDMWLAQELMENLTVCFAHQPLILELLLVDKEFQDFIVNLVLVCPNRYVQQVASEQLYILCVKCCVAGKSILDVIKLLFDNLHKTEEYGDNSSYYFNLLCRILSCAAHHNILLCNADSLLEQEVAWLKSIEHHNTFHPLNDTLLKGHLQVCRELVAISPLSTKVQLGNQDNGPNLLSSLLFNYLFPASKMLHDQRQFPDIDIRDDPPICQTPLTQEAAFGLIGALCKGCPENLNFVVTSTKDLFYSESSPVTSWEFPPTVLPRNLKGFVGLKNGGATCYMNAVLQQLYMIPEIRASLLSLPCTEAEELDMHPTKLHHLGVAKQVQAIFCALKESKHQYYTPEGFWEAFKYWGEPVNLREQHDSLEFFSALLDNLVEGTKALQQPPFITDILEGCFADQKICKGCPHRYTRIEPFLLISVDVRNHENLMDSLDEFVKGDLLEGNNAYHCELCDKKVDTVKRLCFQKLPDVLAIQLKRFGYDWERECSVKYNDYFEFPDELSMERYTVDFLSRIEETSVHEMIESGDRQDAPTPSENSNYRLVGVVVHSGQASGGHYYSYIKQRVDDGSGEVEKWYKFDDVDVSECNIDQEGQMAKLCFGGDSTDMDSPDRKPRTQKRWWNAYILFYERQEYTTAKCTEDLEVVKQEKTADEEVNIRNSDLKYDPPAALVQKVRQDNLNFFHQRSLYSSEFAQFIKHVTLPNVKMNHPGTELKPLKSNHGTAEQIALDCLDLLASYLFQTGFLCKKTVRGRIEEWQDLLLNLLQSSDVCRRWFAANYLFDTPNRFYQYLLECPMADVRSSFAFIIVTLAKLSIPDPPISLSELNAWTADGFSYGMDCMGPLSVHIISGCFALLSSTRVDYNRNMQQLFHVFYCHLQGGLNERNQLLKLGVHKKFLSILLDEGPNVRAQWNDMSSIHNVIAALICSINLNDIRLTQTGGPVDAPCPINTTQILCRALDNETKQLLISDNYCYLRKLLEEPTVMEIDDIVNLLKHICWENARASKVVLMELLYYISSVHSADMKPYLVFLLHILLVKDTWQRKRIQLVLKGGPERDSLLDIILRSKSCHQKRAYLCMKCLTNLLNANSLAAEIFFDDDDNKFRWEGAVKWLGVQLERRPGYHDDEPTEWAAKVSNETGNEYYIERTNSAILLHQKAEALLPEESEEEESVEDNESSINTSSQNVTSPSNNNPLDNSPLDNNPLDNNPLSAGSSPVVNPQVIASSSPVSMASQSRSGGNMPNSNRNNLQNTSESNVSNKSSHSPDSSFNKSSINSSLDSSMNSPSSSSSVKSPGSSVKSPGSSVKSPELMVKSPKSIAISPEKSIKSPESRVKSPESNVKSPDSSFNSSISTEHDSSNMSLTSQGSSDSCSTTSTDTSVISVQDNSNIVDI